jgi:hypothetical protein
VTSAPPARFTRNENEESRHEDADEGRETNTTRKAAKKRVDLERLADTVARLERVVRPGDSVLRLVHVHRGDPTAMVESAWELGLEGVVAKWAGSRYVGAVGALAKVDRRRPERGVARRGAVRPAPLIGARA